MIAADLDFARLDLSQLLGKPSRTGGQQHDYADLPLEVAARPDPLVQVQVAVHDLTYAKLHATDALLKAKAAPGRIAVDMVSLNAFDLQISASGTLSAANRGARIEAEVHLIDGNIDSLRRALGLRALPLSGQIEGHILASVEGNRLNEAALGGHFSAVLAMANGTITRKAIESPRSICVRCFALRVERHPSPACWALSMSGPARVMPRHCASAPIPEWSAGSRISISSRNILT